MRVVLISAILALTPVLAQAECYGGHEQVVMSCAEGLIYDADAQECVKPVG